MDEKKPPIFALAVGAIFVIWLVAAIFGDEPDKPEPKPQPDVERAVVAVKAANLRSGPGTSYRIVEKLTRGTRLQVFERKNGWERVRVSNLLEGGWIYGKLTKHDPTESKPLPKVVYKPAPSRPSKPSWCGTVNPSDFDAIVYKLEPERRRVYLNRVWYSLPIDRKQAVAMYFGKCQGLYHVIDAYSGKEIATTGIMGTRIHQ